MKRVLSVVLVLVLVLSMVQVGSVSVAAEQSGDYTYTITNSTATITAYTGSGGTVTIPDTLGGFPVTIIGASAFFGCTSLTGVSIPNSVQKINFQAFYGCTSITGVAIPSSVTFIDSYIFQNCTALTQINVDANNNSYSSQNGVLFNKNKSILIQYPCAKTGDYVIPTSVTTIEDRSFSNSSFLTSVTIPSSVNNIGDYVFEASTGLTQFIVDSNNSFYSGDNGVLFNKNKSTLLQYPAGKTGGYVIPSSVTNIEFNAFWDCTALTGVSIGEGITTIDGTFWGCTSLASVIFTENITLIGGSSFEGCTSLTDITIPNSVKTLGYSAFSDCTSLASVVIGSNVTKIEDSAFEGCTSLTNIIVPDSVTNIGYYAFAKCSALKSVYLGKNVAVIQSFAFNECPSLLKIEVDAGNLVFASVDGVLFNKLKTTLLLCPCGKKGHYSIPEGVTDINVWAFNASMFLTGVTIPSSMTEISDYIFNGITSLTTVNIGENVTKIGANAFAECSNLTSVVFLGDAPSTIDDTAFESCSPDFGVYYFSGSTGFTNPWHGYDTVVITDLTTAPTGLNVSAVTATWVNLIWSPVLGATGYDVYNGTTKVTVAPISTTSCKVTGLTLGTTYSFTVKAVNLLGESPASIPFNVTTSFIPPLVAPDVTSTGKTTRTVDLSWPAVANATGYFVYSGTTKITVNPIFTTTYTVTGLSPSTTYNFTVVAVNTLEESPASTPLSITTNVPPPLPAPTEPIALSKTSTTVTLMWSAVAFATGYDVYNGTTKVNAAPISDITYTVTGLSVDTTYTFTVKAVNLDTESPPSEPVTVTTLPLMAPTGLIVTAKSSTTVQLSWSPVVNATGYDVYNGITKVTVAPISTTTNYTVTGLSPNTTYNFTVKAVNSVTESPSSNTVTVTTDDVPKIIPGDINGDGDVNLKDVTVLSRYIAGWTGLTYQELALDVNGDGDANLKDVTLLSRFLAGWNVVIN